MKEPKYKVLFVCLGNICRSPAAQGIFEKIVEDNHTTALFEIDSAGTYGGHAGQLPDNRMRAHARRRNLELTHRSRPVCSADFEHFDYIVAMDDRNYSHLQEMAPDLLSQDKIVRMMDYTTIGTYDYVPDPYYEGAEGFELVLDLLHDACQSFYNSLMEES